MRKHTLWLQHRKKFQKDSQRQYLKKYRIFPSFMYARLDKWLKEMSLSGWHIVDCGLITFWFEKGDPMEKEYFTYGDPINEGNFSVSLRHPNLEKVYGLNPKKSQINANKAKAHQIIEIDLKKFNPQIDTAYNELLNDRNRLYLIYSLRNTTALLVVFLFVALVLTIT